MQPVQPGVIMVTMVMSPGTDVSDQPDVTVLRVWRLEASHWPEPLIGWYLYLCILD